MKKEYTAPLFEILKDADVIATSVETEFVPFGSEGRGASYELE